MRRGAAAVDADVTLTYHRFFMSPPFPRALRPSITWLVAASSLATLVAVGCATSDEESKPVTYSLTAKQNYEKGLAELKDENFPEAQKYFQFVKQKYPFSKFAVLAELGIADTQFARGNYTEAIDSYKSFVSLASHAREGRRRLRRLPHLRELLQGHARRRLDPAAVVRERSVGDHRCAARDRRLSQEVPELAVHARRPTRSAARC